MAVPTIKIQLYSTNLLTIINEDSIPAFFYIYSLNDAGTSWNVIPIAPLSPLNVDGSIPPDGVFQMEVPDNLYKVIISDVALTGINPDTTDGYYVVADDNIKACQRTLLLENLCNTSYGCDPVADCRYLRKRMKFYDLMQGLYYIWSQFTQKQSLTMLIVPTNQNLLSMRDYLDQLLDMCGCKSKECRQCQGYVSITSWKSTNPGNSDCGCSNNQVFL